MIFLNEYRHDKNVAHQITIENYDTNINYHNIMFNTY